MNILLVDDSAAQRLLLMSMLKACGYVDIQEADSAARAFEILHMEQPMPVSDVDLILMDLNMPEMDGLKAIQRIKGLESLHDIPIIVITASSENTDLQASFDAGAMDYLTKPPSPSELTVRVRSALQLKQETDQRKEREASLRKVLAELDQRNHQLDEARNRSENLLLNILPPPIVTRLKSGQSVIADGFSEATVFFVDVVGFTSFSAEMVPVEVVTLLNELFELLDSAADRYCVEKIKTMGDAYIAVAGVPTPRAGHVEAVVNMALDIRASLTEMGDYLQIRTGIHTGPVVAGVIGTRKFTYDMWGDTVNVASRMQSVCAPGEIRVTADVYNRVRGLFEFSNPKLEQVKGKGEMATYMLLGRK